MHCPAAAGRALEGMWVAVTTVRSVGFLLGLGFGAQRLDFVVEVSAVAYQWLLDLSLNAILASCPALACELRC